MRFSIYAKNGTIQQIFQALQKQNIIDVQGKILCLYITSIKVHPKLPKPEKQVNPKVGANDEGTRGLCI